MNSTTFNEGHVHPWKNGDKKVELSFNHTHQINSSTMMAEKGMNDHDHKLLISTGY